MFPSSVPTTMSNPNVGTSPTAIEPPSPSTTASTATAVSSDSTETVIVVQDDDDDDDVDDDLAKRLGLLTVYAVGNTQTTQYWYVGTV